MREIQGGWYKRISFFCLSVIYIQLCGCLLASTDSLNCITDIYIQTHTPTLFSPKSSFYFMLVYYYLLHWHLSYCTRANNSVFLRLEINGYQRLKENLYKKDCLKIYFQSFQNDCVDTKLMILCLFYLFLFFEGSVFIL